MSDKKISPAAVVALKQALTDVYWYKSDLRSFLTSTLSDAAILGRLDWNDYKRNIGGQTVDLLVRNQAKYQSDLLRLMAEVAKIDDFSHLARLEDGETKATQARRAVAALRKLTLAHDAVSDEQRKLEECRQVAHERALQTSAVQAWTEAISWPCGFRIFWHRFSGNSGTGTILRDGGIEFQVFRTT